MSQLVESVKDFMRGKQIEEITMRYEDNIDNEQENYQKFLSVVRISDWDNDYIQLTYFDDTHDITINHYNWKIPPIIIEDCNRHTLKEFIPILHKLLIFNIESNYQDE